MVAVWIAIFYSPITSHTIPKACRSVEQSIKEQCVKRGVPLPQDFWDSSNKQRLASCSLSAGGSLDSLLHPHEFCLVVSDRHFCNIQVISFVSRSNLVVQVEPFDLCGR